MEIKTVGVLGAGTMGHGIAQILVRSGYMVMLNDVSQQFLESGAARIAKGLSRDVEKNRLTGEERERALRRLTSTTRVSDCVMRGACLPNIGLGSVNASLESVR